MAIPPAVSLPIIDFGKFLNGSEEDKKACAKEVMSAFEVYGFLYLKNFGISPEKVAGAFKASAEFFALPMEEKIKLEWKSPQSNRGYIRPGKEKVSTLKKEDVEQLRNKAPDLKETIEIGKEPSDTYQNEWPESQPQFRTTMMEFFETCHNLQLKLMSAIAVSLNLPEDHFQKLCDAKDHNLRLLHYPSAAKKLFENVDQARAGIHTDYGTVTLLFQDNRGGLQVLSPDGKTYLDATPVPDTVVINAGDLLNRWTNNKIRSTYHRVTAPPSAPEDDNFPERYSIAFFSNPNWDATISAIPGCFSDDNPPKYPPIKTHDYLVERLSATI